ncbi:MAG: protein kinase [Planctomycetota bacterium]
MSLDDLSANELALIDEVCLEFERSLATDLPLTVDAAVKLYIDRSGKAPQSSLIEVLREELEGIAAELMERESDAGREDVVDTLWATPSVQSQPPSSAAPDQASFENASRPATSSSRSQDTSANRSDQKSRASTGSLPRDSQLRGSVGPYEISGVIARGGMGVVYRATDPRLGRPVAIKTLWMADLDNFPSKRKELVDRFEREARAVASLSHPNIVELFDVGKTDDQPYAVMEFIDGITLATRLDEGKMTPEQTRHLGMQIAGALATSHAAGVIHRDLKPQNIMLVRDALESRSQEEDAPRVKLVDFGLSRLSDAPVAADGDDSATRAGMILGTPGYMSPEQARGEPATDAADVFGLGCVLYEALYGRRAIPGETPVDRLAATLRGTITFEPSLCETSALVCSLIQDCVQADTTKRPSASDLYSRLRQADLQASVPSGASLASAPPTADQELAPTVAGTPISRRYLLNGLAGGAIGALFGSMGQSKVTVRPEDIKSIAVMTLRSSREAARPDQDGRPLGNRMIGEGEWLASAIVTELSKVESLEVIAYRPQSADGFREWSEVDRDLDVDALLTGTYESERRGEKDFWILNWQLIDPVSGREWVADQFVLEKTDNRPGANLIDQARAASDVAQKIGYALVTTGQENQRPDPMAYGCLVKGNAYADADSTEGLILSLKCFEKAHDEDSRLIEPLVSIAFASIELASRSNDPEPPLARLKRSFETFEKARKLDPEFTSDNVALVDAMLKWQRLDRFEDADQFFRSAAISESLDWRLLHQRGLYFTAIGDESRALSDLDSAAKLNPMSLMVKTDWLRANWLFNYESRAMRIASDYASKLKAKDPGRGFVIGLLLDIHEQKHDYRNASRLLGLPQTLDQTEYYEKRQATLAQTPYGPFGRALNNAILELRSGGGDEEMLDSLEASASPMFRLLLARHPAFFDLRTLPDAQGLLPPESVRMA